MKRGAILFFALSLSMYIVGSSNAQENTTANDFLQIPYTNVAPNIDGSLDDIWLNVTAVPLLKFEQGSSDTSKNYDDHFTTFRMMNDENYLYIFVTVIDDSVEGTNKDKPELNDYIELLIDVDNSKQYTLSDKSEFILHYAYGETFSNLAKGNNGENKFAFERTASGYNFEIKLLLDSFDLSTQNGNVFGFEVINSDVDNGKLNHILHWNSCDSTMRQNPSLWGNIYCYSWGLNLAPKALIATFPGINIDGYMSDAGWHKADEITLDKFENGFLPDTVFTSWNDHRSSFRLLWSISDSLHLFVTVIDDEKNSIKSDSALYDCIDLYFDGGNEKTTSYDSNDVHWRYVYGENSNAPNRIGNGPGKYIFLDTENGYNFELCLSKDELKQYIQLKDETKFGFEITNTDYDKGRIEDIRHWWTTSSSVDKNPSLFGTIELFDDVSDDWPPEWVEVEANNFVNAYSLDQNYPNPFNPETSIRFSIPEAGQVTLKIFNILGQEVATLVNEFKTVGNYSVNFNASSLTSGAYFYQIKVNNFSSTKKMLLMK